MRHQRRSHAQSARARSPLSGARLACVPWVSLCLTRRWRSLALSRRTSTTSRTYSTVRAHEGPVAWTAVRVESRASRRTGVEVSDADGAVVGTSHVAARAGVARAILLPSVVIPGCSLLVPTLAMHLAVAPLLRHSPLLLLPASATLVAAGVGVLTPLAAAAVPARVAISADEIEPEIRARAAGASELYSSRALY